MDSGTNDATAASISAFSSGLSAMPAAAKFSRVRVTLLDGDDVPRRLSRKPADGDHVFSPKLAMRFIAEHQRRLSSSRVPISCPQFSGLRRRAVIRAAHGSTSEASVAEMTYVGFKSEVYASGRHPLKGPCVLRCP